MIFSSFFPCIIQKKVVPLPKISINMRPKQSILFPTLILLLLTSCAKPTETNVLTTDFDHFITLLGQKQEAVFDTLVHEGYVIKDSAVSERDFGSYTMQLTLCADTSDIIYSIYATYFPKDSDNTITNDAINSLVRHIGAERNVCGTDCSFSMMTKSPDFAEEIIVLTLDSALAHRDELDAAPSHDYNILYYWIESTEKVSTIEQLYDYQNIPDTVMPNSAGITLGTTLRNTEYPRKQFYYSFSCRH